MSSRSLSKNSDTDMDRITNGMISRITLILHCKIVDILKMLTSHDENIKYLAGDEQDPE